MNYQIKVQGQLDESWSDWLEGMTVTVECQNDDPPITLLSGTLADQSALLGVLLRLHDLNLTVISVSAIEFKEK